MKSSVEPIRSLMEITTPLHLAASLSGDRADLDDAFVEKMIESLRAQRFAEDRRHWIDDHKEQLTERGAQSLRDLYRQVEALVHSGISSTSFKQIQRELGRAVANVFEAIASDDMLVLERGQGLARQPKQGKVD